MRSDSLAGLADSLTPEAACRLIQIACPLTPQEAAAFAAMSDEELLAELDGIGQTARK